MHTQRRFGLNLGGIRGLTFQQFSDERTRDDLAASISGTTGGIGADASHPMVIERLKVWDTHWAFHTYCPAVKIAGLDVFDCNYGIWRSVMDLHQYDDLSFRQIHSHAIFFPMGGYGPEIEMTADTASFPNYSYHDDASPITIVTSIVSTSAGGLRVRGTSVDNGPIARVEVAGLPAISSRDNFAEWEVEVPADAVGEIRAFAVDEAGNVENNAHQLRH